MDNIYSVPALEELTVDHIVVEPWRRGSGFYLKRTGGITYKHQSPNPDVVDLRAIYYREGYLGVVNSSSFATRYDNEAQALSKRQQFLDVLKLVPQPMDNWSRRAEAIIRLMSARPEDIVIEVTKFDDLTYCLKVPKVGEEPWMVIDLYFAGNMLYTLDPKQAKKYSTIDEAELDREEFHQLMMINRGEDGEE